ncbi:MAG: DUF6629 family protein [Waddliaceae bacterium]
MCFSADASFTVGAVVGTIGIISLKKMSKWSLMFLALIPVLFGIQQIPEGFVWLHLGDECESLFCSYLGRYLFLFSAWVIWPTWIPLAVLIPEKVRWRKIICWICLVIGLYISFVNMRFLLQFEPSPKIAGRSIDYEGGRVPFYQYLFYALPVVFPLLISSVEKLWMFGLPVSFFFLVSYVLWSMTFTSVWCFFAAISSLILLKVIANSEKIRQT